MTRKMINTTEYNATMPSSVVLMPLVYKIILVSDYTSRPIVQKTDKIANCYTVCTRVKNKEIS